MLIVDDAGSTRRFLRAVLEDSERFEVVGEAFDGAGALEMAAQLQPDVVLLDLLMPGTDGSKTLAELRSAVPRSAVVVLSGLDTRAAAEKLDGRTAFVPKGLPPEELLGRLDAALGPPARGEVESSARRAEEGEVRSATAGRRRAVVCDDSPATRRTVSHALGRCGFVVVAETNTASDLVALAEKAHPDVAVLDIWMEGAPNFTTVQELRRVSPGTDLLVFSVRTDHRDAVLSMEVAAFVAKPDFEELEAQLRLLAPSVQP